MKVEQPRVLIVEDHDVLRVMLFTILRHQPLAVDTAATVDEAFLKVTNCDYALMLVDMSVPDSESFLVRFHEARPESTTFVLAVRDPNSDKYIDAGVVSAVLNKPLEIDTLAEITRECALVVPPPEEPLECPPSESEIRLRMDRTPYATN